MINESKELISNSFDDRYENEEVAKFCIDNEDRLYIDEPYDIEAFANSISCSNISMAPNFIGYIGGVKLFEYLTNVNRTIKTNKINKFIVVHWVGAVSTALDNAKYFYNVDRKASAGYFVDPSSIYRVVRDEDSSWHCGGGLQGTSGHKYYNICFNSNSIGIEMCCTKSDGILVVSEQTMNNTVKLIAYLMKKWNIGIDMVIRHFDVTGKSCPGDLLSDDSWEAFKKKILAELDSHESRIDKLVGKGIISNPDMWINKNDWVTVKNALAIVDKNTGGGKWNSEESDVNIHWCHPHLISLCGKGVINNKYDWMDFDSFVSYARGFALLAKAFGIESANVPEGTHWGWGFANALINNGYISKSDINENIDMDAPITNYMFIKVFKSLLKI